eukprot:gene14579-biopygen21651
MCHLPISPDGPSQLPLAANMTPLAPEAPHPATPPSCRRPLLAPHPHQQHPLLLVCCRSIGSSSASSRGAATASRLPPPLRLGGRGYFTHAGRSGRAHFFGRLSGGAQRRGRGDVGVIRCESRSWGVRTFVTFIANPDLPGQFALRWPRVPGHHWHGA